VTFYKLKYHTVRQDSRPVARRTFTN